MWVVCIHPHNSSNGVGLLSIDRWENEFMKFPKYLWHITMASQQRTMLRWRSGKTKEKDFELLVLVSCEKANVQGEEWWIRASK